MRRLVGTTHEALIEGRSRSRPDWLYGRLRTNELVHLPADDRLTGRLVPVAVTGVRAGRLEGTLA
jgi:tRNA A37 methylthiotransferase MiaB